MSEVRFYNLPKKTKAAFLKKVVKNVLEKERIKKASLGIVFLGEKEIQRLNFRYRKQNKPTDVLSFPADEKGYLGEVVVCESQARKNAEKFAQVFKKELVRILIHGLLHLLGYDHEKNAGAAEEMFRKQEQYLIYFYA